MKTCIQSAMYNSNTYIGYKLSFYRYKYYLDMHDIYTASMKIINDHSNFIIMEDFNSHSQSWGYEHIDARGEKIDAHQTDTACSCLVCHSRGDCANCIHLPRLSGGPATQFFWEASRASSQHGWRSAYSLRETLSQTQVQNQH